MILKFLAKRRFRLSLNALWLLSLLTIMLTSCTPYKKDYMGLWVGLDESQTNYIVYEYFISDVPDSSNVSVRVTRLSYEFNRERTLLQWQESMPHYFPAVFNEDEGTITTPFGVLEYTIGSGNIMYNGISFTRKAKNTEVKLKYAAREQIKKIYPEIPIVD